MNIDPAAKTILCFGDSNTWGQRPDTVTKQRFGPDTRWTGLLQKIVGEGFYVVEEGLSGRTTDLDYVDKPGFNGSTYLGPCLQTHNPLDLVILMLGTNDLKTVFGRTASEIAAATQGLLKNIQHTARASNLMPAQTLLVSPIHVAMTAPDFPKYYAGVYDQESSHQSRQLTAALRAVAVETGSFFADASQVATAGEDGIHMSEAAHRELGALMARQVTDIFPWT
jgi:lysophospholipase L1-like esterase